MATGKKRHMNDPGRPGGKAAQSAPDKIIDTAERLIGLHGLEGVSLRQISEGAGQRNNYAVQYHFGDLAGLLQAIRMKRVPEVDRRRGELLAKVEREGRAGETRALIDVLFLPLIGYHDATGERRFARFVLALHSSAEAMRNAGVFDDMPAVSATFRHIQAANPAIPMQLLLERLRLVTIMVLSSIFNRRAPLGSSPGGDAALVDNVLEMASAALVAPVSADVRRLVDGLPG